MSLSSHSAYRSMPPPAGRPMSKCASAKSYEYAMVSAAAAVDLDGQRIRSARIALGSIAQKPWRLTDAEAGLIGQSLDPAALERRWRQGSRARARSAATRSR